MKKVTKKKRRKYLVLNFLLLLLFAVPTLAQYLTENELVRRAWNHMENGRQTEAIADFTEAIKLNPSDSYYYVYRGRAFYNQNELESAIADFTKSISLNPQNSSAFYNRGISYFEKGELDLAVADFSNEIKISPRVSLGYYNRGIIYLKQNKIKLAIKDLTKTVELNPRNRYAFYLREVAYAKLKKISSDNSKKDKYDELSENWKANDPIRLFEKLNNLFETENLKGKSNKFIGKKLKDRQIYDNLTTDDYFIFKPGENSRGINPRDIYTLEVKNQTEKTRSGGVLYRLGREENFPEPGKKRKRVCGMGAGGGGMGTGYTRPSREKSLNIEDFSAENDLGKDIWQKLYLPLDRIYPSPQSKNYKGVKVGSICNEFFVPVEQKHYVLAFINKQKFPLVEYDEKVFSLKTYQFEETKNYGLYAADSENRNLKHLFVVRLVAPYIKSETKTIQDGIEGKPHRAEVNKIYVELVAVWLYRPQTGEVLSRRSTDFNFKPDDDLVVENNTGDSFYDPPPPRNPVVRKTSLQIISKPPPRYTEEARKNNYQGMIRLRVEFLANGKIGKVTPVTTLKFGLTENAVFAAQNIKFKPATRNGEPITVTKIIQYTMTIY